MAIEESSRVKEENYRLMNRLSYAKRLTSEKETEFQTKIQYLNDKISRLEKLDARK